MAKVIGIDLGTTNSVVAYLRNGHPEVIVNAEGGKLTPSVVLYRNDEPPLVGELAKRQMIANPESTVRSVKRLMGRRMEEVVELAEHLPFKIASEQQGEEVHLRINGRKITPVEVSSHILAKLRQSASDFLDEDITQAVITVPAYFNDAQRQATKLAAREAGLEPLRIVNEPTAAALAYGINRDDAQKIAVFDFGGGTFDISILDLDDGVFEVLSSNGDTELGGDNIDQILATMISDQIVEQTGVDPRTEASALQRVHEAAERVKCELSTLQTAVISLPFIVANDQGPQHFTAEITRNQFNEMIGPILERLAIPCRHALADAGLPPTQIESVVLVGGSTRIPAVQSLVADLFGREPVKSVNPDEAVALGAAIQGGILSGDIAEILLLDVTPLSLGIEIQGGAMRVIIPRNSSIPVSVARKFTTIRDNQDAVQVHILQGERNRASENRTLARLRLAGISPAPAEVPEIEVIFTIDADGILSVSATDVTSGVKNRIVVESYASALTAEVQQAIVDGETHAEEDRAFLEVAYARQRATTLVQSVERYLQDNGQALSEKDLAEIREALFRLEVCIHAEDLRGIQQSESKLIEVGSRHSELFFLHRMGER